MFIGFERIYWSFIFSLIYFSKQSEWNIGYERIFWDCQNINVENDILINIFVKTKWVRYWLWKNILRLSKHNLFFENYEVILVVKESIEECDIYVFWKVKGDICCEIIFCDCKNINNDKILVIFFLEIRKW